MNSHIRGKTKTVVLLQHQVDEVIKDVVTSLIEKGWTVTTSESLSEGFSLVGVYTGQRERPICVLRATMCPRQGNSTAHQDQNWWITWDNDRISFVSDIVIGVLSPKQSPHRYSLH